MSITEGRSSFAPGEFRSVEVYEADKSTHPAWCRWLASRGSLAESHRGCAKQVADICVANAKGLYRPGDWRGRT